MNYSLELYPALADEIEDLKHWHEAQRTGLGERFYAELLHQFSLIISNPLIYAIRERDVRVVRLSGFSYLIRYRILGTKVRVLSVIHAARVKGRWKFRR
jgi:toxin ParE1/3/4